MNVTMERKHFDAALHKASDAYQNFIRRMSAVAARVENRVRTQPERFEHVRTAEQLKALVATEQDSDKILADQLGSFDRWAAASTMHGTAVLIAQNDEIIRLLKKMSQEA